MQEAIQIAGYAGKVRLAMDVAASEFYSGEGAAGRYDLDFKTENNDGSQKYTATGLQAVYEGFVGSCADRAAMISIEDPFDQVSPAPLLLYCCCSLFYYCCDSR